MPLGFHAARGSRRSTHVLLAPDAEAGQPAGASLQQVLEGLRALPNDSRLGIVRSIASLAYVLDRPIEVVEMGLQGGLHRPVRTVRAGPLHRHLLARVPGRRLVRAGEPVRGSDRRRASPGRHDRAGPPSGDGSAERPAARALGRGRRRRRGLPAGGGQGRLRAPDRGHAGDGRPARCPSCWSPPAASSRRCPRPVVALALADLVRRPGVSQLAIDQARLLGPLGAIEDEDERRRLHGQSRRRHPACRWAA